MQRGDIYPHVQLKCWKHICTLQEYTIAIHLTGFRY